MDFQFTQIADDVQAKCAMEHIAFAHWFNIEVQLNAQLISTALSLVQQARQNTQVDFTLTGSEYSIFLNADEVMVRANNLAIEANLSQLDDDFHYYNEESISFCGLDDFEHFLLAYQNFIH